jgi:hypothetical protein
MRFQALLLSPILWACYCQGWRACPFVSKPAPHGRGGDRLRAQPLGYNEAAVRALDANAVEEDIKYVLNNSRSDWPADWGGNYGPLIIRLAWHCAGSYR